MRKAQRHRLIVDNIAWATKLARNRAQIHSSLESEELISVAMVALVEAAKRYKPDVAKFKTFAAHRIIGAMTDYHRGTDPAGRHYRALMNQGVATKLADRGVPIQQWGDAAELAESKAKWFPHLPATQEAQVDARMALYRLRDRVAKLPARLGAAYARYYFEDCDLKTIARDLGVTESRVCQMMGIARRLLAA